MCNQFWHLDVSIKAPRLFKDIKKYHKSPWSLQTPNRRPGNKFKSHKTERLGNESWTGASDGFPSQNVYRFKNMLLPEMQNNWLTLFQDPVHNLKVREDL